MAGKPILAAPSAPLAAVLANLPAETHGRGFEIVSALYAAGVETGVDPVGLIAQSGHETGWWNYPGLVRPEFYNTAGIKVRWPNVVREILGVEPGASDHPLEHQQFQNLRMGVLAHAWHVRRYAGESRPPSPNPDPRWDLVAVSTPAVAWRDLSGRWAVPGVGYGERIEELMGQLSAT